MPIRSNPVQRSKGPTTGSAVHAGAACSQSVSNSASRGHSIARSSAPGVVQGALGVRVARYMCALGALTLAGCGLFRGAVNDSPDIRWWLFSSFGASHMCPEMLKHSAPLRLTNGGNVIGRLFPNACTHRVDEQRRTVSLEFTGTGYAWTPIAGRVGFSAHAGANFIWRPTFARRAGLIKAAAANCG